MKTIIIMESIVNVLLLWCFALMSSWGQMQIFEKVASALVFETKNQIICIWTQTHAFAFEHKTFAFEYQENTRICIWIKHLYLLACLNQKYVHLITIWLQIWICKIYFVLLFGSLTIKGIHEMQFVKKTIEILYPVAN